MYFKIFYTFLLLFVISNLAVDLYNLYNTGKWEPFGNIIEGATSKLVPASQIQASHDARYGIEFSFPSATRSRARKRRKMPSVSAP